MQQLQDRITKLFEQYPDVNLIVGGIRDQTGTARYHEFSKTTGFNIADTQAWFLRPGTEMNEEIKTANYWKRLGYLTAWLMREPIISLHEVVANIEYKPDDIPFEEYAACSKLNKEIVQCNEFKELYEITPSRRIMVIGWLGLGYEHKYICDAIERQGMEVIRIAADYNDPNKHIPIKNADFILQDHIRPEHIAFKETYPMLSLVEIYEPDEILILQNDMPLDFAGITVPMHYYAHEILWRRWPINAKIHGFFYAYYGAPRYYNNEHKLEYVNKKFEEFVPYAWNPEQYPPR